jgi:hypothetical protein
MGKFLKMLSVRGPRRDALRLSMQFYAELAEHSMLHLNPLVIARKKQTNLAFARNNRYNFPQSFKQKMTYQQND